MLRKLIQKGAVNSWKKEVEDFTEKFESLSLEQRADFFIYGTRTRAGLQIEGHLALPDGSPHTGPELLAYPLMISWLERIIDMFNKQGAYTDAGCVSIWRYTLLAFLYPDLQPISDRLWASIMETKSLWKEMVNRHYEQDLQDGLDPDNLKRTYALVIEILKDTPPKKKHDA